MGDSSIAFSIFRGINKAVSQPETPRRTTIKVTNGYEKDNSLIANTADDYAGSKKNKSGITVALEDFTSLFSMFRGMDCSNITSDDAKQNIFHKMGFKPGNMYKTDDIQEMLQHGAITQKDIFASELEAQGGIRYAQDDDDVVKSAQSFAAADIGAIEKPLNRAYHEKIDGELNARDIDSYKGYYLRDWNDDIKAINLDDNDTTISPEEYASYLLCADGIATRDAMSGAITLNKDNIDGVITQEEAEYIQKMDDRELKELAQAVYDEYFAKN